MGCVFFFFSGKVAAEYGAYWVKIVEIKAVVSSCDNWKRSCVCYIYGKGVVGGPREFRGGESGRIIALGDAV